MRTHFPDLDFRRFQIDLRENIEMDDVNKMDQLLGYGSRLGRMIVNDQIDKFIAISPNLP